MTTLLLVGFGALLLGILIGYLVARLGVQRDYLPRTELAAQYVHADAHRQLQELADVQLAEIREKEGENRSFEKELAVAEQQRVHLQAQVEQERLAAAELRRTAKLEFEQVANRLLQEKGMAMTRQNEQQLQSVLNPLRAHIKDFKEEIERKFVEDVRDKTALKEQIIQLAELNQQLSQDAVQLAAALKGDSKKQGDWGELQLELILEKAGLERDLHFYAQPNYKDDEGRDKRPDFVVKLPGKKHLIVDSKVSLTAYERFCSCDDKQERKQHLTAHVGSLRKHLRDLESKRYPHLRELHSPDYLLLYVPVEPAFAVALRHDPKLFTEALERNIVIVTNATLLATLRTVGYIWTQDRQQQSVLDIARESGKLYDKFVGFVDDLQQVGKRLDQAQDSYDAAFRKLKTSKRRRDTLIGRAEHIRRLGAQAGKRLPVELLGEEEE